MAERRARPGKTLELFLQKNPELDIKPFVAWMEQNAKQSGDLDLLREIRAYRRAQGMQ